MDVANQDIHGQMMSISVWLSQWNLINAKIVDMNPLLSTAQFNHSAGLVVGLTFFRCLECWSAMTSPFVVDLTVMGSIASSMDLPIFGILTW